MPKVLESVWDAHLSRMNQFKHRVDLLNKEIRPVNTASFRVGPTERQFVMAEINRVLAEMVIEPMTTVWAEQIVAAQKTLILRAFASTSASRML